MTRMIVVRLPAAGLARVRLAPSPASELTAWLRLAADRRRHPLFGEPGPSAQFALRDPDVAMLARLLRGAAGYVPDLLTPKPPAGDWAGTLDGQLELVRHTPDDAVAAQVAFGRRSGQRIPVEVRRAVESGTFARRAANGMHSFWLAVLADDWRTLDAALEADVWRRARTMAAHGIGRMFDSLHPKVRWSGDQLRIDMRYSEVSEPAGGDLVLSPSILGWPKLRVQVCDPANAVIMYPAGHLSRGGPAPAAPVATLVGPTRAAILASLDAATTTTQLSRLHGLAPSTVSHHLTVLLRAGMAAKVRDGAVVHYARTERGDALVHAGRPTIRSSSNV